MRNIQSYFAEYIGENILYQGKEVKLDSVGRTILTCYNGNAEPIHALIEDCFIIEVCKDEIIRRAIPPAIAVVKVEDGSFVPGKVLIGPSKREKFEKVIEELIKMSEVSKDEYYNKKTRKREVVWSRQIHMITLHRILRHSQSSAGATFSKDHATVVHAGNVVDNLMDVDKEWKERYENTFKIMVSQFGDETFRKFEHLKNWMHRENK